MCGTSKRWRPLWSSINAMIFYAWKTFYDVCLNEQELLYNMGSWYVNWVDQILRSHKGSTINRFISIFFIVFNWFN